MTIKERIVDDDLGLDYNDMGLESVALRAQLTRVLAATDALVEFRAYIRRGGMKTIDEGYQMAKRLIDAADALEAAGDIDSPADRVNPKPTGPIPVDATQVREVPNAGE
jgi:hypothetical protein